MTDQNLARPSEKKILVLGVGNILLSDEGVGIRVLRELEARYEFPANVELVDGGVLGLSLTGVMMEADQVVVIDAVRGGDEPGTCYRFAWECKPGHISYKDSLHQIDLMETMGTLPLVGDPPEVVVIGVEFDDIVNYKMELTPKVERAVPKLVELVVAELERLGAKPAAFEKPKEVYHVLGGASQSN